MCSQLRNVYVHMYRGMCLCTHSVDIYVHGGEEWKQSLVTYLIKCFVVVWGESYSLLTVMYIFSSPLSQLKDKTFD